MWWGGLDLILYFTGEAVLYTLTFGKRKPIWNIDEVPYKGRTYRSMLVGFIVLLPVAPFLLLFFYTLYLSILGG